MHKEAGGRVRDLTRQLQAGALHAVAHETIRSLSQFDKVCASSEGGPGLNFGEQMAGRSILGTTRQLGHDEVIRS